LCHWQFHQVGLLGQWAIRSVEQGGNLSANKFQHTAKEPAFTAKHHIINTIPVTQFFIIRKMEKDVSSSLTASPVYITVITIILKLVLSSDQQKAYQLTGNWIPERWQGR
jgi:hypothetical protein